MTSGLPEEIYLLGTGLIGGSLALDLKASGIVRRVVGYDTDPDAVRVARQRGILDDVLEPAPEAYRDRIVVLAVPVLEVVRMVGDGFPSGTLVTDVGSVKMAMVEAYAQATERGERYHFVPGHPIAGDENSGPEAARQGLFAGARVILTPDEVDEASETVARMWSVAGARVEYMAPPLHDAIFAWVSHLPHMAAYALVDSVMEREAGWVGFSAGGLRDYTRIAGSSPRMWSDIAVTNGERILEAMSGLRDSLDRIEELIRSGDRQELERHFARAAEVRRKMS